MESNSTALYKKHEIKYQINIKQSVIDIKQRSSHHSFGTLFRGQ